MVSFEAQQKAELLIHQVAAIEQTNKMLCLSHFSPRDFHSREELELEPSESLPLADDLSSQCSEDYDDDDDDDDDDTCDPSCTVEDRDSLPRQEDPDIVQWRSNFLSFPHLTAASDFHGEKPGNPQRFHAPWQNSTKSTTIECKSAMHQILVNSDLKRRKLEYEVLMLRRVYEDAKLTIERYEQKVQTLQEELLVSSSSPRHQLNEEEKKEVDPADICAADLKRENHLNKLVTSRNKALDENLKLKKQLLSCCSHCREQMKQPRGDENRKVLPEPLFNPIVSAHPDNNSSSSTSGRQQNAQVHPPPQPVAPRPTFQKAALAMVQKLGGGVGAENVSNAKSSSNSVTRSFDLPEKPLLCADRTSPSTLPPPPPPPTPNRIFPTTFPTSRSTENDSVPTETPQSLLPRHGTRPSPSFGGP